MKSSHVKFEVNDSKSLERLRSVFLIIKKEKESKRTIKDEEWKALFTKEELSRFWWPTDKEKEEWVERWKATPVKERFTDSKLKTPWDFLSMIDSFFDGEYDFEKIVIEEGSGYLIFQEHAYPFGGTEGMRELIKAFGHKVIGYDDGTGFQKDNEA